MGGGTSPSCPIIYSPWHNIKIKIYKTVTVIITVSFVLYGCGTWSVTLRKEHNLRVSENGDVEKYGLSEEDGKNCIMTPRKILIR
jgi:hypothetical protein